MADLRKEMIFGTQKKKELNENVKESTINNLKDESASIINVPINKLIEYREKQPFSIHKEAKMRQIEESMERNGVLNPILIRRIENGMYEIIDGRNRVRCAKKLNYETIPAIEKDVDDVCARLIMLDTNLLQRDDMLPVEKGKAYKMRLETIKKLKEKGAVPLGQGYSVENLSDSVNESETNIKRLIRLVELIEPLQEKVNSGTEQLSIRAGVELSYINPEEQEIINKVLDENNLKLKISQAETLRSMSGNITEKNILELFIAKNKEKIKKFTGKLNKETLKKYKEKFSSDDDFNQLVDKLLEEHFKNIA